jgi:hypothetical protein
MNRNQLLGSTNIGPNAPPKGWKSPFRNSDGTRKLLYQIMVEVDGGDPIFIGPAFDDRAVLDCARSELQKSLSDGNLKGWSNPTVVCVTPLGLAV